MKVTVRKEQIIEGLQKAANIIPAKAGAAYLRSIWLRARDDSLSLMSTDANLEFTGTYEAVVDEPGLAGVQGRAFVDLLRQLPNGEIRLSLDSSGSALMVEQGKRNYKLPVNSKDWFQEHSAYPDGPGTSWTGDIFIEYMERVSFCIGDADLQDAMRCLCMKPRGTGRIDVCGLNGHQFGMVSFVYEDLERILPADGLLIEKKFLQDIRKWLSDDEIELKLTDKRLFLRRQDGKEMLSMPRVLAQYPDYMVFMKKLDEGDSSLLTIPRKAAQEALGRIQVFNSESDRCVFFDMTQTEVNLSAQGSEGSARECLDVDFSGSLERIAFPTKGLMEILGHFTSDNVVMKMTGNEGPCGITGIDDISYTVVVMPMKVANPSYYKNDNEPQGEEDDA